MKRVAVIGASSFVGRRVVDHLRRRDGAALEVVGTVHAQPAGPGDVRLDVTDARALDGFLAADFDHVLLVAGTKDLKRCEGDWDHAVALNARPVEQAVRTVRDRGLRSRILYFSSDYVFDGERGRYRDVDAPAPRTAYGRSKLLGEEAVLAAREGHKVLRSAAVLGRGGVFFEWLVRELGRGGELRLFADSFMSPTPAALLAEVVGEILDGWEALPRVLHVVGDQRLSRFEVGGLVASLLPSCPTRLVPETGALAGTALQRDLSMVPSEVVRRRPRPSLAEYLAQEIAGC